MTATGAAHSVTTKRRHFPFAPPWGDNTAGTSAAATSCCCLLTSPVRTRRWQGRRKGRWRNSGSSHGGTLGGGPPRHCCTLKQECPLTKSNFFSRVWLDGWIRKEQLQINSQILVCLLPDSHTSQPKVQFLMPSREFQWIYRHPRNPKGRRPILRGIAVLAADCAPGGWRMRVRNLVSHASNELLRHTTGRKRAATNEQRYQKALNV
jgi:hypothetical protein